MRIQFIVGAPRSGKSEAVETELGRFRHKLYVGTLWPADEVALMLQTHRERRGNAWRLVECRGDIAADIASISAALRRAPRPSACLIDGLGTWFLNVARWNPDLPRCAVALAYGVVDLVGRFPHVAWRLIDVPPDHFLRACDRLTAQSHRAIHTILDRHLPLLKCGLDSREVVQ